MEAIDVRHLGREKVIACWRVGEVLIDPGPTTSLDAVVEALGGERPGALLLTHIHLDHAGGTGKLVERWPELEVYVHERGAPHVVDPAKLLASARRLYGEHMDRLWGEILPVPEENVTALSGGEEVLGFEVAYTPGHASHHVSYLHLESGRAFVGDTCGIRIPPSDFVVPPTPPPDIDVEAWFDSLERIEAWDPTGFGLTHFGPVDDPAEHLERMRFRLRQQADRARELDADEFARQIEQEGLAAGAPEGVRSLAQAAPPDQQWAGLDRYWRKKAEAERS